MSKVSQIVNVKKIYSLNFMGKNQIYLHPQILVNLHHMLSYPLPGFGFIHFHPGLISYSLL